ncbi:MAG: riboflavin biosynthesis protein RibF [Chloroflexi bacterium]|nr:riboflavin biosynthesis protein RibF [Chloroflexota bacterium]MYB84471.1 riboflavin biosynthesis protein RibF [Chloroflexota bacterium]
MHGLGGDCGDAQRGARGTRRRARRLTLAWSAFVPDLCEELTAYRPDRPAAVAFGVFDGVHLGHRHVLATLVGAAKQRGLAPVAVTLANHPFSVLRPDVELRMLTSLEERLGLLADSGVAAVVPVTFTKQVSLLTPREFMTALRDCLGMAYFAAGPDVTLGHNREGTLPVLEALGEELGYTMECVEQFTQDGGPVRSTAVRQALDGGDVASAARMLGRPFALEGPVVEGEHRGGGLLGYPTANVGVGPQQAVPADGIYAGWLLHGTDRLPAAVSIGHKPTFHEGGPSVVEAFVLDFDGNLYGEQVKLEFVERLRGQEKFDGTDALIAAMRDDVTRTRRILALPQEAS